MPGKRWSAADEEFLCERWGTMCLDSLSERLGRTPCSVMNKVARLGLGRALESGDYVSFRALAKAMGYHPNTSPKRAWVERRGLPVHYRKSRKQYVMVVYMDEFWQWAYENRTYLDFSRFPYGALGIEPKWVDEQRKKDMKEGGAHRYREWTTWDDLALQDCIDKRLTWEETSKRMGRTVHAIRQRLKVTGKKLQPAETVPQWRHWTHADKEILREGLRHGYSVDAIAEKLGRSSTAVRAYVLKHYGTGNVDKARKQLAAG